MKSLSGNQIQDLKELYASIYKSDDQEISETTANLQGLPQKMLDAMKAKPKVKGVAAGQLKTNVKGVATASAPQPDYSGLSKAQIMAKKRIASKEAGTYTKPKTAQELAKERIGSGTAKNPDKTIAQVKADNKQAMIDRAKARHDEWKKKRDERRAARVAKEELSNWRQDLKEIMGEVEKTE